MILAIKSVFSAVTAFSFYKSGATLDTAVAPEGWQDQRRQLQRVCAAPLGRLQGRHRDGRLPT